MSEGGLTVEELSKRGLVFGLVCLDLGSEMGYVVDSSVGLVGSVGRVDVCVVS